MNYHNADPTPKRKKLPPTEYRKLREAAWKRAGGLCDVCQMYAPLDDYGNLIPGHLHHIKSRGAGGDDDISNAQWLCHICHGKHHGPRWSK